MRTLICFLLLLTLGVAPASAANERGQIQVTPYLGFYAPQSNVLEESDGAGGFLEAKMNGAMGFGGAFTVWVSPTVALQATGFYVPTTLEGQAFGQTGSIDASLLFFGGRIMVGVGGGDGPSIVNLSAGLVANSSSYDFIEGNTSMAGVIGAAVRLPLSETLGLDLAVDDYLYNAQWQVDDLLTQAVFQHDVVLRFGLSLNSGGVR